MEIEALQMTPVKMQAESHLGEEQPQQALPTFGEYLKDALGEVNALQKESERLVVIPSVNSLSSVYI